jgi:hypothetical protein
MYHSKLFYIVVLVLTIGSSVRSQCTPRNNPAATLLTASFNASNTITFDNIGLYDRGGGFAWFDGADKTRSVSAQVNQTILLSGPNSNTENLCFLTMALESRVNTAWNGQQFWDGSTSETPGFYLMAYRNGFCTLQFDPPISAFVARAVSDASPDTWLEIYDEAAQLIECAYTPNVPGTNTYAEIGFSSTTPIAYVRFRAPDISTFFADSIQYETCEEGFVFNMTECIGKPRNDLRPDILLANYKKKDS